MSSVAVVTCIYGDNGYDRWLPVWVESILALRRKPDEVILVADREYDVPGVKVVVEPCTWEYSCAFYLNAAALAANSEWVWTLGIDDLAMPDGLDGIDEIDADVWQLGYLRSDGRCYAPPQLQPSEYLSMLATNPYVGASVVKRESFCACGGYPDIEFEDWGLWRRMARGGMRFLSSKRQHFHYTIGTHTQSAKARSLWRTDWRQRCIQEMLNDERMDKRALA